MKKLLLLFLISVPVISKSQDLKLNEREYFERQGINVLVFSNNFNGGFNDEKNSGIEIIHHGVRTIQGGAVRLNNTPEQWDLVPKTVSRTVDREKGSIEVVMRYDDYDFDSRVVVTAKAYSQLMRIMSDGSSEQAYQGEIKTWGPYYKYNYVKFDFSEVRQAITLRTSTTGHSFGAKTRALLLEIPSM